MALENMNLNRSKLHSLLKSNKSSDRIIACEIITDLYESNFVFKEPEKELVSYILNSLLETIILEKKNKVQNELLCAFYNWSWFLDEGNVNYSKLFVVFDRTNNIQIKEIIIRIFMSTGSVEYMEFYKKCLKIDSLSILVSQAISDLGSTTTGNNVEY